MTYWTIEALQKHFSNVYRERSGGLMSHFLVPQLNRKMIDVTGHSQFASFLLSPQLTATTLRRSFHVDASLADELLGPRDSLRTLFSWLYHGFHSYSSLNAIFITLSRIVHCIFTPYILSFQLLL